MDNILILCGNALLYIITLFYWARKKGWLNVGVTILCLYSLMAVVAIPLFLHPLAFYEFEQDVTIFPFIYLYIMLLLMAYPLLKIEDKRIKYIQTPPIKFINIIIGFIIISCLYKFYEIIPNIQTGLFLLATDSGYGAEVYEITTESNMSSKSMTGSIDIIGVVTSFGVNLSVIFFWIYLCLPKKNKIVVCLLALFLIVPPLEALSQGSRELVVVTCLNFVLLFIFFYRLIPIETRKRIVVVMILLFCGLFFLFGILSNSRTKGDSELTSYRYERYLSESFLIFNQYCLNADGTREGMWVSAFPMKMLGKPVYSPDELRFKYKHLGIDNSRFYTYVGDFVLDYGPLISFIVFVILSLLFQKGLKYSKVLHIEQILLAYILIRINSGFYLHQFTGIGGNLVLLELLCTYVLFKDKFYFKNRLNMNYIKISKNK